MTYYTFLWDAARDDYAAWGTSTWYFEVDPNQDVVKQLEHYANGIVLTYDETHAADTYGMLSDKPFDPLGTQAITKETFYALWNQTQAYNRS
jgi:hypothetical protein